MKTVPICVPLKYYLEDHTENDGFQDCPQSDLRTWPSLLDARRASKSHDNPKQFRQGRECARLWSRHGACDVVVTSLLGS